MRVLGGKQVQVRVCRQVWERVCKVRERDEVRERGVQGEQEQGGMQRLHDLHDCMSNFDHARRF